jgi:hypothetical protein
MALTITKTSVTFPGIRLSVTLDPDGVTLHYWLTVGYTIHMDDGETINRDHTTEIIGNPRTTVANIFAAIQTILNTKEGLP